MNNTNQAPPPVRLSARRGRQEEISKESDGNDDVNDGRLISRNPPIRSSSPGLESTVMYSSVNNSSSNNNNNNMPTPGSYEERLIETFKADLRDEMIERLRDELTEKLRAYVLRDEVLSTSRGIETERSVPYKNVSSHTPYNNNNNNNYTMISSTHQQPPHAHPQSSLLSDDEEDHKQFLMHLTTEMGYQYQYPAIDIGLEPGLEQQPRSSNPTDITIGEPLAAPKERNSSTTNSAPLAHPKAYRGKFFSSNYSTSRENVTDGEEIDGIHSWVILVMTKPRDSFGPRNRINTLRYYAAVYLTPLISWVLIGFQILVLNFIGYQSGLTYCKEEREDCEILGQVCSSNFTDHDYYFGDEIGLCIDHPDKPIGHCSYLTNLMMPNSSKFVIIIVFLYITASVLHEMAQDYLATKAGRKLSRYHQCGWWVQLNIWCWHLLRGYFLPMMTYYAAVLILFVEADFKPSTILLNGVAVDVVLSFDDQMAYIFLCKATQAMIARKMNTARDIQFPEQQQTQTDEIAINRKMWWHNRLLCSAFTIASLIAAFNPIDTILNVEKFLPFVPLEATSSTGFASCNDFALALGMALMWYSLLPLFIVLDRYIHGSKVRAMIRDFILGWGFIYLVGFLLTAFGAPMHLSLIPGVSYLESVLDVVTHGDDGI